MKPRNQNNRPTLAIGLMSAPEVSISFISGFSDLGKRHYDITGMKQRVIFTPISPDSVFEVEGVTIGVGFHWEQRQVQRFSGAVELVPDGGNIVVINHVDIEEYLRSVISSEMNAESPMEFLKAHAVISRSWVLRQIKNRAGEVPSSDCQNVGMHPGASVATGHDGKTDAPGCIPTDIQNDNDEIIRWYDREDHSLFDVCADDHCQRYQGVTRLTSATVAEAVDATAGMVLMHDGKVCDARFSKCCGGVTEEFGTCWNDEPHPYLKSFRDIKDDSSDRYDLTTEEGAHEWILSRPASFCNTSDHALLGQVLNNFDQVTTDFYRWTVKASAGELAALIKEKSGLDVGELIDLVPIERGPSGRLCKLKIIGSRRTVIVGKELEIRRLLSPSHLYSSAFIIEKSEETNPDNKKITTFTLRGAGWGHGVGLCQIGAAAMSAAGYDFKQILEHYYPGASITKIYE